MKNIIKSVKGTYDYYPPDMAMRNWLYNSIKSVSESFGYQEYEGPLLETIDLYAAKSGEELVKEQAFVFPDKSGDLITLRPELTPSLARMVAQKQNQLTYPLRWWSYGPMWRYERPQKGRGREFFQWNIDLVGLNTPECDAELIAIAASLLKKVGLTPNEATILVNNRELMDTVLGDLSIPLKNRQSIYGIIDRRDKLKPEDWEIYALNLGLTKKQFTNLKKALRDYNLWQKSEDLTRLFENLDALGLRDYVEYAPFIVRGLDYYTGTVFECYDKKWEFRAILGGGRYDNLVADVGGNPLSGVGFAMGDKVIMVVLEHYNKLPKLNTILNAPVLVTVFDKSTILDSNQVAAVLRKSGINTAVYPEPIKLGKQFRYADRIDAKIVVILGPDEIEKDLATIKNLKTREQVTVSKENLANSILEMLES